MKSLRESLLRGVNLQDLTYQPKTRDELVNLINDDNVAWTTIDTSLIRDMSWLFRKPVPPHKWKELEEWDVSNVTTMRCMFNECEEFNADLSKWDVSNVKDTAFMFAGCTKFEGKGIEDWDVSKVTDMRGMFAQCPFVTIDLSSWDVGKVKDMSSMFTYCRALKSAGIEDWDVSRVRKMDTMFKECTSYDGKEVENWDVSKVQTMTLMFYQDTNFNADLSNWDVKALNKTNNMFDGCVKFEGKGLDKWEPLKIKKTTGMFNSTKVNTSAIPWFED